LLEARDARAVQQEKAAADKHASQPPSSGQEGALLPRRSESQVRPPPSSPSKAQVTERKNEKSSESEESEPEEKRSHTATTLPKLQAKAKRKPSKPQAKAQRTSPKPAKEANVVREEVQVLAQQVATLAQTVDALVHMRTQAQPEQQQHAFHSELALGWSPVWTASRSTCPPRSEQALQHESKHEHGQAASSPAAASPSPDEPPAKRGMRSTPQHPTFLPAHSRPLQQRPRANFCA
jgi:hypothetical protein